MKRTLIKVTLAALAVVMLGSCEKINQRIDALEDRLDGIETEKIASIDSQIASINSSIADLGTIRSNITSLRSQVDDHSIDIFNLEEADRALNDRILNLEDYLDDVLPTYAEKDWVKATFSTLEQYEATCDTIAKIDARIGRLDERLSKEIKACADSMKKWVNVQFEAYYTAAEMDAALSDMQDQIDSLKSGSSEYKMDSLANELTKTKAAVDSAKAQLTREYKAAIDTAITHCEGRLTKALTDAITKVNDDITALTTRVSNLEVFVATLTGRVTALEGMIQSVTIVPAYSDGSVKATKDGLLYLDIIVEPATAVAGLTKDKLKVLVNEVKTKAVSINTVEVADIKVDVAKGTITARANISSKLPVESDKALTIAVNVKNGLSDYTTEFCPVTLSTESNVTITDGDNATQVTIQSDADFPKSSMGNIVVDTGFKGNKPTAITMGGIGSVTFDTEATSKIKANAEGEHSTNVFFKVEDVSVSKPVAEANLVYEVTMKTVDEQGTEVFAEGKAAGVATVSVQLGEEVKSVKSVSLVDESGRQISGGVIDESVNFENGILTFQVNHFSRYAIKYTLKENVAQIGSTKYFSLAEAVAAVPTDGTQTTITMIGNDYYEVNNPIVIGANLKVVLDLNGKTVSAIAPSGTGSALITNKGILTIKDSGSEGKLLMLANSPDGREIPGYASNTVTNYGTLVVNSGTLQNETQSSDGSACYPIDNVTNGGLYSPTVEINGGRFITKSNAALRLFCNSTTNDNNVTINGGYFEAVYYALQIRSSNTNANKGAVVINHGEFEATDNAYNCSVVCWNGNSEAISLTINGGNFNDCVVSTAGTNNIYGGLFKYDKFTDPDDGTEYKLADYISFGYHIEANTDTQTKSAYPWRVAANPAANAEVSVSKSGQTTLYSTLAAFRDATNAGNTFAGYTVTLLKDIDMTGVTDWKAIGDDGYEYDFCDKNFSGIFDGNGKTISNLAISSPSYWGAALFGYVDGTVKNLTISNSSCSGKGGNAILAVMCGGNVTIENCHLVNCAVSTSSSSGLMISYVLSAEKAVIKNCSTDANSSITSTGGYQIGGIIGQTTSINTLEITDCVNRASVTGIYGIGGIIGQFGNNITSATLTRCKNYGAIQLTNHTIQYAGGIAGVIPTTTSVSTNYKFVDCENHGTVTAAPEWPTYNSCTGGMIGYAYQNEYVSLSMTGCKNNAAVGSDRSIYSGGMIGWHHYAAGTGVFQYTECTNTGAITATQNAQQGSHNAGRAGQLVGCSDNSHDNSTNCVLTGTASANGVTKITGEE